MKRDQQRHELSPIEERTEDGGLDVWLIRWPLPSTGKLWWVEVRDGGCLPIAHGFKTEGEAREWTR